MDEDSPLLVSSRPPAVLTHHATRAGASAGCSRLSSRKLINNTILLVVLAVAGFLAFYSAGPRWSSPQQEHQRAGLPEEILGGMEEMDEGFAIKEEKGAMTGGTTKPNVFFILIDDMGWDDIGYQTTDLKGITPNLDKLAAGGVKLTNYYTMPICTPARATLMTGRYTVRYGMQYLTSIVSGQPWGVPLSEKLFPEYMQDAGYETHMVGKWHLGDHNPRYLPSQRGFDTYMGYLGGAQRYWSRNSMDFIMEGGRTFVDFGFGNATGYYDITERPTHDEGVSPELRGPDMKRQYSTDEFHDRVAEVVKAKSPHDEQPLYMYVAHQAVHFPIGLPPEGCFTKEETALLDAVEARETSGVLGGRRRRFSEVAMYLDKKIGQLVDLLEEEGWMDNSIIAVASDNGGEKNWGGSNYPLRGEKNTYWEGGCKVPAFVYSKSHIPEEAWGTEYNGLMHVSDWISTIAGAANIEVHGSAGPLDSVNQWSHIVDPALARANANGDYPRTEMLYNFDPYTLPLSRSTEEVDPLHTPVQGAFRSGKFKMLFNVGCRGWHTNDKQVLAEDPLTDIASVCGGLCNAVRKCDDEMVTDHLYDIEADPREINDIIDDHPEVAQRLREQWHNVALQEYTDSIYKASDETAYDVWIRYNWWIVPWLGLGQEK